MDFPKRTRASAWVHSPDSAGIPKLRGGCFAFNSSANADANAVDSTFASGQSRIGSLGRQEIACIALKGTPTYFLKLPARILPAVLPAIALVCFAFFPFLTVHGQASLEAQEVEVQQLIEQLAQADFDQREAAERQLIEIGSPAVDLLISTLLDCKPDVCSRVKRILQTVAGECDEESLFKVLAALRIRFEVSTQRIQPLLDRWAIQIRSSVVNRWRQQGAIVMDPLERAAPLNGLNDLENQMRRHIAAQQVIINVAENSTQVNVPDKQVVTQPIAERLKMVLDGTLDQNKRLVLNSKQGAAGFEKNVNILQRQPVSVTIGEDWRGEYSDFDFTGTGSTLPISNFEIQKKAIDDSLFSVLSKHPLVSLSLNGCTVGTDVKETLPASLGTLVIEGSDNVAKLFELIPSGNSSLNRVRFVGNKFGKAQAVTLSKFQRLTTIELVRIDLEKDAFEAMASLRGLRRVDIERCKFPASAFIDFQQQRKDVRMAFTAKAFLGVSSDPGMVFRRIGDLPARQVAGKGCVIATVVPGEAADRAGMEAGDEVVSVGGQEVKSFDELRIAIAQCEIGEEVSIEIRRDGKEKTLKATMGIPDDLK